MTLKNSTDISALSARFSISEMLIVSPKYREKYVISGKCDLSLLRQIDQCQLSTWSQYLWVGAATTSSAQVPTITHPRSHPPNPDQKLLFLTSQVFRYIHIIYILVIIYLSYFFSNNEYNDIRSHIVSNFFSFHLFCGGVKVDNIDLPEKFGKFQSWSQQMISTFGENIE